MAQKKISQLPQDSSPTVTDSVPTYDIETSLTKRALLSDLITLFFNNIPTGAHSDVTRGSETIFDFAKPNTGVWTADSVGVNKNASMTALTCYINGRRISISAVTARVFTASKDTYIDVLDNLDGTGTLVYTEQTNNSASPALAANSIRIGIIVTGATTIAAAGSINQGQEDRVLPIASSVPYSVTDSLGNLICPRDPSRRVLGYKQVTANQSSASGTAVAIAALSCPVIVTLGRKIIITLSTDSGTNNTATDYFQFTVWDGTVGSGTEIMALTGQVSIISQPIPASRNIELTPAAASKTYNAGINELGGGTATFSGSSVSPGFIRIEHG